MKTLRAVIRQEIDELMTGKPTPHRMDRMRAMARALRQLADACDDGAVTAAEARSMFFDQPEPEPEMVTDLLLRADDMVADAAGTITEWDLPL
jgi:hypothetical protein